MPTDSAALAAHARTLDADAAALAECAARLRGIATRLREHEATPPWLYEVVNSHVTACVVASGDLAEAATRLDSYAALVRRPAPPRP